MKQVIEKFYLDTAMKFLLINFGSVLLETVSLSKWRKF